MMETKRTEIGIVTTRYSYEVYKQFKLDYWFMEKIRRRMLKLTRYVDVCPKENGKIKDIIYIEKFKFNRLAKILKKRNELNLECLQVRIGICINNFENLINNIIISGICKKRAMYIIRTFLNNLIGDKCCIYKNNVLYIR